MKIKKSVLRRNLEGYMFISPFIVGFLVFTFGPLIASFYLSFCDYNILEPPRWVGLGNYKTLLFRDPLFWKSLYNTVYYTIFSVPLGTALALMLAMMLNQKIPGQAILRTVYYLPCIVPIIASSVLWVQIFNPQWGLLNMFLRKLGLPEPGWLISETWAKPALIIMSLWAIGGAIIIFLAGLQGIPDHLYESAEIDGAGAIQKFFHITLPMLSPTIFFLVVMGVIGSFQVFTQAYVMTGGGPLDSTRFYILYLFNQAFEFFHMGYGCAMAWILFAIILAVTYLQFRYLSKFVYYEAE